MLNVIRQWPEIPPVPSVVTAAVVVLADVLEMARPPLVQNFVPIFIRTESLFRLNGLSYLVHRSR